MAVQGRLPETPHTTNRPYKTKKVPDNDGNQSQFLIAGRYHKQLVISLKVKMDFKENIGIQCIFFLC